MGERWESDGCGLSFCSAAEAEKERAGIMGLEFEQTERKRALSGEYIGFNTPRIGS